MSTFEVILNSSIPVMTAIGGWWAGRKKRNNDFISDLQGSIDNLSDKYTKTLNELVEVKQQNAKLLIGQNEMTVKMEAIKQENAGLKRQVSELTEQLQNVKVITKKC